MKLYTYYRSQASFRVRIALNLKGITREDSFLHLEKGDQFAAAYRAINQGAGLGARNRLDQRSGLAPADRAACPALSHGCAEGQRRAKTRLDPALARCRPAGD